MPTVRDVLDHNHIHSLSLRKILEQVFKLTNEIVLFLETKNINCSFTEKKKNNEWLFDSAFAVDIRQKLNEVNIKFDGKYVFTVSCLLKLNHLKPN